MHQHTRTGSFLRKEECPICGSSDNVAVYSYDEDDTQETWVCMTPDCSNKRTAADALAKKLPLNYDDYLTPYINRQPKKMKTNSESLYNQTQLTERLYDNITPQEPIRGIPARVLQEYGVKVSKRDGRLLMPSLDVRGTLHRVKWRWVEKKPNEQSFGVYKASNECLLFGIHTARDRGLLFITEGEIDALSVKTLMPNNTVVSVSDGAASALRCIDSNIQFISEFSGVYLVFDADTAGRAATEQVITKYPEFKTVIMPSGYKDANEVLQAGYEACEAFKKAVKQARYQEPDYIDNWDNIEADLLKSLDNPMYDVGTDTGVYTINNLIGGWRANETTCIFAPPGQGKSTLCRTLVYQQALRGIPSVVVSTEESSAKWVRNLALTYCGELNADTIAATKALLQPMVTFINPDKCDTQEKLLRGIEMTTKAKGAFLVLFDNVTHYSKTRNPEYWKAITQITNWVVSFVRDNPVHFISIGHITKGAARADEPNLADADGGNALAQFSHNVIHITRYKKPKEVKDGDYVPAQPDLTNVLTLLKRRESPISVELPSVGALEYLTYIPRYRTYVEVSKVHARKSVEELLAAKRENIPEGNLDEPQDRTEPNQEEIEVTVDAHEPEANEQENDNQETTTNEPRTENRQPTRAESMASLLSSIRKANEVKPNSKSNKTVPSKGTGGKKSQPRLHPDTPERREYLARMQERWQRLRRERVINTGMVRDIISQYRTGAITELPWVNGKVSLSDSVITNAGKEIRRLDGYQLPLPSSYHRAKCMAASVNQET